MIREVRFYDEVDDALLKFAVIAARSEGKWVFCRHKERTLWRSPGDIGNRGRAWTRPPRGSCGRRRGRRCSASGPCACIPWCGMMVRASADCTMGRFPLLGSYIAKLRRFFCWRSLWRGIGRIRRYSRSSWRRSAAGRRGFESAALRAASAFFFSLPRGLRAPGPCGYFCPAAKVTKNAPEPMVLDSFLGAALGRPPRRGSKGLCGGVLG